MAKVPNIKPAGRVKPPPPPAPPRKRLPVLTVEEVRMTCDICGPAMLARHCKLLCPSCGYTRDCSDP